MSSGCTDLQKYIKSSHKTFYAALDDDCATGLLGARKAEYPRGAVVPSAAGFAVLKKMSSPEKRIEFLRSHCLVTGWTPDELKIDGRYLVTRNQKRLPVKNSGGKKVELANGAVLELVHSSSKAPKTAVYKVSSGVVEEGEPSERKDLGISPKGSKGGASQDTHYYGKERSYILSEICEVASGKKSTSPGMAGVKEIMTLVAYAVHTGDTALAERVESVLSYAPIIESFLIFGSKEVVSDKTLRELISFCQTVTFSEQECASGYQILASKYNSLDACKARRQLVQSICKGSGLSDPLKLINSMTNAYDKLASSNTINGVKVFKDGAAAMHKATPKWKKWADDFRFRWWTVLTDISGDAESSNEEYAEALGCMQMELLHKQCNLLNPSMLGHISSAATKMMLTSDLFLCFPMSSDVMSKCQAVPLASATEDLRFTSALQAGLQHFSATTIRRGGGVNEADVKRELQAYLSG